MPGKQLSKQGAQALVHTAEPRLLTDAMSCSFQASQASNAVLHPAGLGSGEGWGVAAKPSQQVSPVLYQGVGSLSHLRLRECLRP